MVGSAKSMKGGLIIKTNVVFKKISQCKFFKKQVFACLKGMNTKRSGIF